MTTEQKYMKVLFKNYMLPPDKIPLIVSNTVLAGYFFGDGGLAVVSFLMPVFFLFETFGFWINYGAFAKSIESVSKNETEMARSYSLLALTLSVIVGIILSIIIISTFPNLINILEIPAGLHQMAEDYGIMMAVSGIFLVIASYCWQFVKMIGLQAKIRKIYVLIMLIDALVAIICIKIFDLGIVSLPIGMIGALLFVILMSSLWLFKNFKQNLFAKIKNPIQSIIEIFSSGSAPSLGKIYSLFIMFGFNIVLMRTYGVNGVAIFALIQTAIRICRLHSQVTWQPLLPILTMEYGDKNLASMLLLLKHSLIQAVIMAVLPAIVIFFGADYFITNSSVDVSFYNFAVESFKAYSLSVVFAAINSIFIIAYSITNHKVFSNVLELLRSLILIVLFINCTDSSLIFWSFLFAEVVTLILIAAVGFVLCKLNNVRSPLLLKDEFFRPSLFLIVDRQQGLTNENKNQIKIITNEKIVKFIDEWLQVVKKFSDTGKNDFTSIHITDNRITLRSAGKLYNYNSDAQAKEIIQSLEGLNSSKYTYTLGMNNLYLTF